MFDSNSRVVKVGGYIIIGFFTLIIIISFGMPDFMSRMGMDENTVAVVNGEKIYRLDYLRYRERFSQYINESNSKQMEKMILDRMIMQRLMVQQARELGLMVSEERVKRSIKDIPFFRNEAGKFDGERLDRYLDYTHQSLSEFYKNYEEELLIEELRNFIQAGVAVPPEEIKFEYVVENSKMQIKYCFLSNKDLRKRYRGRLNVSEKEIDEEMKKNTAEIKDPKTDRNRIKKKLENIKFNNVKREITKKINEWAKEEKSFNRSCSYLGGDVSYSEEFNPGEQIKERGKKGKMLYSLSNSPVFKEDYLKIEKGKTSRAIEAFDGIYVFTPVKKDIDLSPPSEEKEKTIAGNIIQEKSESIFMTLMSSLRDTSVITKNLKFN